MNGMICVGCFGLLRFLFDRLKFVFGWLKLLLLKFRLGSLLVGSLKGNVDKSKCLFDMLLLLLCIMVLLFDMFDMNFLFEFILMLLVVMGVGGVVMGMGEIVEDMIFLVGEWFFLLDVIVVLVVLCFCVCGGMVLILCVLVFDGLVYCWWRRGLEYMND